MILTKEILSKTARKGRTTAISLLGDISRIGNLPEPHYEYRPGGYHKKRNHFHKVKFKVPLFIQQKIPAADRDMMMFTTLIGSGRDNNKQFSKTLAALEVVHQLEYYLNIKRGKLNETVEAHREHVAKEQEAIATAPLDQAVPGVSWAATPVDGAFPEGGSRRGRIDFFNDLRAHRLGFAAAKAITLTAKRSLPHILVMGDIRPEADHDMKKWANIKANGRIKGWSQSHGLENMGTTERDAEYYTLTNLGNILSRTPEVHEIWDKADDPHSSFGMGKLYVGWPKLQFEKLKEVINKITEKYPSASALVDGNNNTANRTRANQPQLHDTLEGIEERIAIFRRHQQRTQLPIDQVESKIPFDAPVAILRGGTGSGKTTRYPLMLSLFTPDPICRVVVAQPRRLACQTAAQRVASEQDSKPGTGSIGYAIRFESRLATAKNRTVDFLTPGVLLRQATADPLLSWMTHLCIDEVHERNADIDLLLALAKQAAVARKNHPTLSPLRLTLMSATLDSDLWERYFDDEETVVVDAPSARRFPIEIMHLDHPDFPLHQSEDWLNMKRSHFDYDDALCKATADLALKVYFRDIKDSKSGSVLCFLPGMDEIRKVTSYMAGRSIAIHHLHSSVDSKDQAKAFIPGPKVILSTNLAETSVTIPDVKVVIDTGRERQFSMLDSNSDTTSVVGSQLVTVNISQASAKQRAGRAGRVSAGTCYRLYASYQLESLEAYTKPEMLRMDLSQMLIHTLSLFQAGHPLSLLQNVPDPPTPEQLRKTTMALRGQGLVTGSGSEIRLTPLGKAVSSIPASPRLGRMLFMGLSLRAIEPALTIAALLSVPRLFSLRNHSDQNDEQGDCCSDLIIQMRSFDKYIAMGPRERRESKKRFTFDQVTRVREQLARAIRTALPPGENTEDWNINAHRVGAQAALVVGATPHIAHLTSGSHYFATRDVNGSALIHPSSANFKNFDRCHWYVYNELRTSTQPYMNVTTAVSPMDVALFSDPPDDYARISNMLESEKDKKQVKGKKKNKKKPGVVKSIFENTTELDWLFIVDEWVPVDVREGAQQKALWKVKCLLTIEMLQQIALDPSSFREDEDMNQLVLHVLSVLEQQRLPK